MTGLGGGAVRQGPQLQLARPHCIELAAEPVRSSAASSSCAPLEHQRYERGFWVVRIERARHGLLVHPCRFRPCPKLAEPQLPQPLLLVPIV